jgi:prepilin-type processing-associated H-X9-DG protein
MSENSSPRTSLGAIVSLLLGVLSPVLTGIPALILGFRSLRQINASEGRLQGRVSAVGGMVLGVLGTLLIGGWLAWIFFSRLRARSNQTVCLNNLRGIGLGTYEYHFLNATFPPGTLPALGLPPERRLSWLAGIVPFLDAGKEHQPNPKWQSFGEKIHRDAAWDDPANAEVATTRLTGFLCPAHPPDPPSPFGLTHYVGFAGLGRDAAILPKGDPRCGMFGYNRVVRDQDVSAGLSTTFLATETEVDNGPWAAGGPATVRGLDPDVLPYVGPGAPFGGLHAGGLNVLMVDGSARFVRDTIKPEIFREQIQIAREP